MSGKTAGKVVQAWGLLYRPEGFLRPEERFAGSEMEYLILFGCMAFGIFSFWRHAVKERISVGVFAAGIVLSAECFGIFSEWMPGGFYFYLLCVLLASVSLGQCFMEKPLWGETLPGVGESTEEIQQLKSAREEEPEEVFYEKSRQEFFEGASKSEKALEEALDETGFFDEDEEDEFEEIFGGGKDTVSKRQEEAVEGNGLLDEKPQLSEEAFDVKVDDKEPMPEKKAVKYIENPLPLPKKHVKRVMDYTLQTGSTDDDFDYAVDADDDFDI